ncbi:MAG TPA: hypothetical protein VFK58_08555 [Sphingomicrobium sp.]|nr:hypothetical protein [Sphingomicrobium sp.]
MTGAKASRLALATAGWALPLYAAHAQAAGDYGNASPAAGSWSHVAVAGGSEAHFRDSGGTIRVIIACARATRQVTVARTSAAPATTISVWTSTMARTIPARFDPNAMRVSAQLAPYDGLLDAIAFSRGRFAVSMPGFPALVVSAAPEAARVIEDCRS